MRFPGNFRNEGCQFWVPKLSTRCNQDNQREFEERAFRQIESALGRKLSGDSLSTSTSRITYQSAPAGEEMSSTFIFKQKNVLFDYWDSYFRRYLRKTGAGMAGGSLQHSRMSREHEQDQVEQRPRKCFGKPSLQQISNKVS